MFVRDKCASETSALYVGETYCFSSLNGYEVCYLSDNAWKSCCRNAALVAGQSELDNLNVANVVSNSSALTIFLEKLLLDYSADKV